MKTIQESRQAKLDEEARMLLVFAQLSARAQKMFERGGKAMLAAAIEGIEEASANIAEAREEAELVTEEHVAVYQEAERLDATCESMLKPMYEVLDMLNAIERAAKRAEDL